MQIRTKLYIIIAVTALSLAGITALSQLWQRQTESRSAQEVQISEMNQAIFNRARLREEYFSYRTDRARLQFLHIHKEIGERLNTLSIHFRDS